ncbi:MAG: zinc ribbon domain-containing protein [Christensenellales bacterium]
MAQEIMERRRNRFGNKKDVTPKKYPFSGKIVCEGCGKNYKRKIAAGKPYWQCSTFLQDGKGYCQAKQIPEEILHTVTAEALGLMDFEAEAFTERIAGIRVPEANRLVFVFRDAHLTEQVWHDRSRADSWTEEMKQLARDRMTPELREASRQRMHEINRNRRGRI